MNHHQHACWRALALACALACGPALADTSYVAVRLDKPVIQALGQASYGAGTEYQDQLTKLIFRQATQWTGAPQEPSNRPLYDAFKGATGLNPGAMRFPDGTGALHYYWNYVCSTPNYWNFVTPEGFWTPEEVYRHLRSSAPTTVTDPAGTRTGLGAELVVQLNTDSARFGTQKGTDYQGYEPTACGTYSIQYNAQKKRNELVISYKQGETPPNDFSTIRQKSATAEVWRTDDPLLTSDGKYQVRADGLAKVAEAAGEWLRANRRKISWAAGAPIKDAGNKVIDGGVRDAQEQVDYWEFGNEDWDSWTPQGYAWKFVEIGMQMKRVQAALPAPDAGKFYKPLRFVVQAFGQIRPASTLVQKDWVLAFAAEVDARYKACLAAASPSDKSLCVGLNDVWALSLHPYNQADHDVDLPDRTGALFAKVDASTQVLDVQRQISLIKSTAAYGTVSAPWEIWATEYNQDENKVFEYWAGQGNQAKVDEIHTKYYNTKVHGLYMADMTARMLSLGVKKVFPFGVSNSAQWALFNYGNGGSAFWQPRWMPAGIVMRQMFNQFQGGMYPVTVSTGSIKVDTQDALAGNATRSYTYKSLAAYATLDAAGNLRMMLINRSLAQAGTVALQVVGRQFDTSASLIVQELKGVADTSNFVTDSELTSRYAGSITNLPADLPVDWLSPSSKRLTQTCMGSNCTLNQTLTVQPGSMVFVTLPTKLR